MIECVNCGNESHCGIVLKEEKCCGESIEMICMKCNCELCYENTECERER